MSDSPSAWRPSCKRQYTALGVAEYLGKLATVSNLSMAALRPHPNLGGGGEPASEERGGGFKVSVQQDQCMVPSVASASRRYSL